MNEMPKIDQVIPLQQAIEFLWAEADILDKPDYDRWLQLWNGDGHYVIPIDPETEDFASTLNVAYDDAQMRKLRVERLQGGFSISAAPPAKTVRTISRFVTEQNAPGTLTIRSALHLVEDKFGRQRVFAANVTHRLVVTNDGLKIRDKVIRLLNSDGVLTSISYLL
ncbi:aromatic-ring-hydroxylating dioxygenase subunit beta [Agrobacterium sp. SORGH_AS 787]|uniref:aromatic-ring-hydroxylating dioxygenase subunit beta n=1 Tax=Agrobacterium sp. SORGH_AS 787 TaxID=3041775 RepID=UPI002781D773|nr:3-phenylpropionate/cinnamic acid dioxygenase small subunit [Rhizobium sp. SORGH_AS_0787]